MASTKTWLLVLGGVAIAGVAVQTAVQERVAQPPSEAAGRSAFAMHVAKQIKGAAHDPDSIKFTSVRVNGPGTLACVEFRGRNSVGATVLQMAVAQNGTISTSPAVWNKHCIQELFDLTPLLR